MDIPKFEDYSELKTLDGDKVKIDDILNKPIIVTGYTVMNSKYKNKSSDNLQTALNIDELRETVKERIKCGKQ